jgi:hypothetical protein
MNHPQHRADPQVRRNLLALSIIAATIIGFIVFVAVGAAITQ